MVLSIQQFLTKISMTPMPHPSCSPDLASSNFFVCLFLPDEESPQRETFCLCGRGKTKEMAEALNNSKTVLNSGKNVSVGVLHQMESTLKVTEV